MTKKLTLLLICFVLALTATAQDINFDPPIPPDGSGGRQLSVYPSATFNSVENVLCVSWNICYDCEMVVKTQDDEVIYSFAIVNDGLSHNYVLPTLCQGIYIIECYADETLICIGEFYKP